MLEKVPPPLDAHRVLLLLVEGKLLRHLVELFFRKCIITIVGIRVEFACYSPGLLTPTLTKDYIHQHQVLEMGCEMLAEEVEDWTHAIVDSQALTSFQRPESALG